jgi:hypothetical protein
MIASVLTESTVVAAVLVTLGTAIAGLLTGFVQGREQRRIQAKEPSFADRVEQAIKALRDASKIVGDLESEINSRRTAVERLQDQQELLKLDQKEIEAVSHLLRGDAQRESRRAIWISVGASAFFFLAGVGVTLLVGA